MCTFRSKIEACENAHQARSFEDLASKTNSESSATVTPAKLHGHQYDIGISFNNISYNYSNKNTSELFVFRLVYMCL